MALDVEITKIDGSTYNVKLSGMLDANATTQFNDQMETVLSDASLQNVILELPNLTFISSAGMGSIAMIRKAVMANKGAVVIISATPAIKRVIEIVKVLPREMLFASRADAEKYLGAIQ